MEGNGDLRLTRVEKARQILNHPAVVNASQERQQRVIQILLDKGLRQDDLQMLLAERQQLLQQARVLENLPYDAFYSIVTRGEIEGKDLIYLCNVSTKLSEMCNRSRDVDGQQEDQFLFRELLRRLGKGVKLNTQGKPMTPKLSYIYYELVAPRSFASLEQKIRLYSDLLEIMDSALGAYRLFYPTSIFSFLYYGSSSYIEIDNDDPVRQRVMSDANDVVQEMMDRHGQQEAWVPGNNSIKLSEEETAALRTLIEKLNDEYMYMSHANLRSLIVAAVRIKQLDFINYLEYFEFIWEHANAFRNSIDTETCSYDGHDFRYLKALLEPFGYQQWLDKLDLINVRMEEVEYEQLTPEEKQMINDIQNGLNRMVEDFVEAKRLFDFTEEEMGFIIDVHEAVMKGKLALDAPFTFDAIFPAL